MADTEHTHEHHHAVAIESAGLILVRSNPLDVVKIIELSRASYHKMIQNLW